MRSVSLGQICSDNSTCCHTETEIADPTLHLTQSQYTDTGPTSPSADPITPGAWQGSHLSTDFQVTGLARAKKKKKKKKKVRGASRNRTQACRSRGGRLNHQATGAVISRVFPRLVGCETGKSQVTFALNVYLHFSFDPRWTSERPISARLRFPG